MPIEVLAAPAAIRAPTRVIPEIAFDPDISGVCRVGGIFVMIFKAQKGRPTRKTVIAVIRPMVSCRGSGCQEEGFEVQEAAGGSSSMPRISATRALAIFPSCVTSVSRTISSSISRFNLPVLHHVEQERGDVLRIHLAGVVGDF